jgi:hypothetical protein
MKPRQLALSGADQHGTAGSGLQHTITSSSTKSLLVIVMRVAAAARTAQT